MIEGEKEYRRWKHGAAELTPQEAIDANCYVCNNRESTPCNGEACCALYQHSPFKKTSTDQAGPAEE